MGMRWDKVTAGVRLGLSLPIINCWRDRETLAWLGGTRSDNRRR